MTENFTVTRRAALPVDDVRVARDAAQVRAVKARRRRALTLGLGTLAFTAVATPIAAFTFFTEPDGLVVTTDRQVVASGTTEAGNRWEARAYGSPPGACLDVALGPVEAGGCGVPPTYGLSEGAAVDGRPGSYIVSGLVPDDIRTVTVVYQDGSRVELKTLPVPQIPGVGRAFVLVNEPKSSLPLAIEGRRADGEEAFSEPLSTATP